MKPTKFQSLVQDEVRKGSSVLLVAPTGLGKTFAVVGDVQDEFRKIVYAVPLRALGGGIRDAVQDLKRNGKRLSAVIHHGDSQESLLFSEEVIVTTYDQVVCGVPGLPLSLPLKAGHAVAGALLMSRLVLDEVHLAWAISDQALGILLAIVEFRKKLGLQTVVLTATLPSDVAKQISEALGLRRIVVGEGDLKEDEGLQLRNANRKVRVSLLELKNKGKDQDKQLDYAPLDGSRARGDADEESDLDLFVRLKENDSQGVIKAAVSHIACDLTLEHGVLVAAFVADEKFLNQHEEFSFLKTVEKEGVLL